MNRKMHHSLMRITCAAVVGALLLGCRTDGLLGRRPASGAPVVPIEEFIERTRESETSLAEMQEVDLVEDLIQHRIAYLETLADLQSYYDAKGQAEKYRWASTELTDARAVHTYQYLLDSEARIDLQAQDSIPEADECYDQALALLNEAGHGMPALYHREKMVHALALLKQVIREYPTSDKIDDSAFYCGELHKEYFPGDESIAVYWYERAWHWNPQTPHPVRFQAAVVYDYRLHDRERALVLYRAAIAEEAQYNSNAVWAQERIKQLTRSGPVESFRTEPVAEGSRSAAPPAGQSAPPEPN